MNDKALSFACALAIPVIISSIMLSISTPARSETIVCYTFGVGNVYWTSIFKEPEDTYIKHLFDIEIGFQKFISDKYGVKSTRTECMSNWSAARVKDAKEALESRNGQNISTNWSFDLAHWKYGYPGETAGEIAQRKQYDDLFGARGSIPADTPDYQKLRDIESHEKVYHVHGYRVHPSDTQLHCGLYGSMKYHHYSYAPEAELFLEFDDNENAMRKEIQRQIATRSAPALELTDGKIHVPDGKGNDLALLRDALSRSGVIFSACDNPPTYNAPGEDPITDTPPGDGAATTAINPGGATLDPGALPAENPFGSAPQPIDTDGANPFMSRNESK
jgi:hypothetical protein